METDIIKHLYRIKKANTEFKTPDYLKDCISRILEQGFEKGGYGRGRVLYIIATDLRRIGKTKEEAKEILIKWNYQNSPPLEVGEIQRTINSAFGDNYEFGCNKEPVLIANCHPEGKEFCQYYKDLIGSKKRIGHDRDFIRYGWCLILQPAERQIYYIALPYLENQRGIKPGFTIYASYRDIHNTCGVTLGSIKTALEGLARHGLIMFKVGKSYYYKHIASEIKRIIPIPKPSCKLLNNNGIYINAEYCSNILTATVKKSEHIEELHG